MIARNHLNKSLGRLSDSRGLTIVAKQEHLKILRDGVDTWNAWRAENLQIRPDLSSADLSEANLSRANLSDANLFEAYLLPDANLAKANLSGATLCLADIVGANLSDTNLTGADLARADLSGTNLSGANLSGANLPGSDFTANLSGADLRSAKLSGAYLRNAILFKADLREAVLEYAVLVDTNLEKAKLSGCYVYGISAWNLNLTEAEQLGITITHDNESRITIDNLMVAQFIYLLLNNKEVHNVIDTITSKVVLILGRFTNERKTILDAIREELRRVGYTPVLFDFAKPDSKDLTGTVELLARMARFIVADLTDPSSIPHELATIVPFLRTTPVLPLRLVGTYGYSMFEDLRRSYSWVLPTREYEDCQSLISALPKIIAPVDKLAEQFRRS